MTQYNKLQAEFGTDVARINGFDDKQLSYTDFISNFIDTQTVADASVDGNSNVSNKDIVTLVNEMPKPHQKLLAYNKIYYEIQKEYGFQTANECLRALWTGQLYLHDANTSTFVHYCYAYDLKRLAEEGLYFLTSNAFNAQAPQHLGTFIDFVKEFISYSSNRSSGAVGLPNLIPYMFYFWNKDVKENYLGLTEEWADKFARQHIQRFVFAVNQPYTRNGIQSAFTNCSVFDRPYFEALFGGSVFPDGTFMIDYEDEIINFQKIFLEVISEIRADNMMTFPVLTMSLLRTNGKFADEEFADWCIRHNMKWSDSNLFIDDSVTSLSNCCRLKSNVKDLGYFNSVGGTALSVGSVKVSTINLVRIALDTDSEEEFIKELKKRINLDCIILDRVRHIIRRNVEKGLLPNFTYGLVDFAHLYNTIGIIGCYEVFKKFGYIKLDEFGNTFYTDKASAFGKKIFETIHTEKDNFCKDMDYSINIEQIPGESAASKLMQLDKFFYPKANVYDLPLYGNQFIPLGIKTTFQERVRIQAEFDGYCNGGSILHANIDAPFDSFEKAKKMVEYIADQGVTYFAFNTKIQACSHNHGFYGVTCPKCGEPVATEYTRIVGFYTPISSWAKPRKEEYKMRRWADINVETEKCN